MQPLMDALERLRHVRALTSTQPLIEAPLNEAIDFIESFIRQEDGINLHNNIHIDPDGRVDR